MQINEFLSVIRIRRCIHRFKQAPIPDDYIEMIIEAARWAMSGGNTQPWEFIVVKDQETKNIIAKMYLKVRKGRYPIERSRVLIAFLIGRSYLLLAAGMSLLGFLTLWQVKEREVKSRVLQP